MPNTVGKLLEWGFRNTSYFLPQDSNSGPFHRKLFKIQILFYHFGWISWCTQYFGHPDPRCQKKKNLWTTFLRRQLLPAPEILTAASLSNLCLVLATNFLVNQIIHRGLPRVQYDALRRSQRGLDENWKQFRKCLVCLCGFGWFPMSQNTFKRDLKHKFLNYFIRSFAT